MQTPAYWQSRFPACLLLPLAAVFGLLAGLRRWLYRAGWLRAAALPVPVVVIGNITAGGAGKTPVVRYLAERLLAAGIKPGIVSRGYGGTIAGVAEVPAGGSAAEFGDEPLLLAHSLACPVFVGRDRAAAGRALLAAHPATQVLLCDDGLQHYRLARQLEIVVIDGNRGMQNGWLLPAGPLREPTGRLFSSDALVINGKGPYHPPAHPACFRMQLEPGDAWNLADSGQRRPLASFAGQDLAALAGIGHPARFFATLKAAGLDCREYPFPDHHAYQAADLLSIQADCLLATEKDAVKLRALLSAGSLPHSGNIWVVPVAATFAPDLADWLCRRLNTLMTEDKDGRQTA
ncbi:tetraacyldisaccharide 4'-kinase [Chitinimonas arctica]|uniref:Tetraacyldisaccharide 4'-kinase n=1 Tax=Chitinimonas arctica TaxID=2594795 RepID=A0A516SDK0_9NEIS|nr:tetraacyldisaccharide 4'-kinase [Chitinimonas arctica]QDQ26226.1 tetraacyldisaccharide 4'-kinase [Chitinimonas arctica]